MREINSKIPVFPIDIFPSEIINLIIDCEKKLKFPYEYLGSAILTAASVAIGNSCHIRIKNGFETPAIIFMVLVGNAGAIKSAPLNFAFEPIKLRDKKIYDLYSEEMKEYNLNKKDSNVNKPVFAKTQLTDFTPEVLVKIHSYNKRSLVINVDELYGWIKNFQRYNKSSEQENYLSIWGENFLSVDRKGDEPIVIEKPFVNVIGTMQTKILSELAKNGRQHNGFIERLLFAIVKNSKPLLWGEGELNNDFKEKYHMMIDRLFSIEHKENSLILEFSSSAKKAINTWQNECSKKYNDDDIKISIQRKLEYYCARFSLIIELMNWAFGYKEDIAIVEKKSVIKAIKLVEYYRINAEEVFNIISGNEPISSLNEDEKEFYCALPNEFTTQKAIEISRGFNIDIRKLYRLFKKESLFIKISHGNYQKTN